MINTGYIKHNIYDNRETDFYNNNIYREDQYFNRNILSYVQRDKDQYEKWLKDKCATEGSRVLLFN